MNISQIAKAHIGSLKLLTIKLFTLPLTIYYHSVGQFVNPRNDEDSDFRVLTWIKKCYDALIVLSYTVGIAIFIFVFFSKEDPIWQHPSIWDLGDDYAHGIYYSYDYDDYVDLYTNDLSESRYYYKKDRIIEELGEVNFNPLGFFGLLVCIYFMPLLLGLLKEIFSLTIIKLKRLGNIEQNTKKVKKYTENTVK